MYDYEHPSKQRYSLCQNDCKQFWFCYTFKEHLAKAAVIQQNLRMGHAMVVGTLVPQSILDANIGFQKSLQINSRLSHPLSVNKTNSITGNCRLL